MAKFYARTNPHGDETSTGFANTMQVEVFSSKRERDDWVQENQDRNMAICAITAKRAKQIDPDLFRAW